MKNNKRSSFVLCYYNLLVVVLLIISIQLSKALSYNQCIKCEHCQSKLCNKYYRKSQKSQKKLFNQIDSLEYKCIVDTTICQSKHHKPLNQKLFNSHFQSQQTQSHSNQFILVLIITTLIAIIILIIIHFFYQGYFTNIFNITCQLKIPIEVIAILILITDIITDIIYFIYLQNLPENKSYSYYIEKIILLTSLIAYFISNGVLSVFHHQKTLLGQRIQADYSHSDNDSLIQKIFRTFWLIILSWLGITKTVGMHSLDKNLPNQQLINLLKSLILGQILLLQIPQFIAQFHLNTILNTWGTFQVLSVFLTGMSFMNAINQIRILQEMRNNIGVRDNSMRINQPI